METETQKLKALIETSDRILATSHISPDADAVSSLLLFGSTLKENFPDKDVHLILEDAAVGLDFMDGYEQIEINPLASAISRYKPQLLVMLDGNNYRRFSRNESEVVRQAVESSSIKTVIIDHHENIDGDKSDVYINQGSPAVAQDVYEVFFEHLGYKKPRNYAQITMTGLYSDTGGFAYDNPRHSATFRLADDLIESGANIEQIRTNLYQYTVDDLLVLAELSANTKLSAEYSYSFVSDKFVDDWLSNGRTIAQLSKATDPFVNGYLRNIENRKWGFIVYKNTLSGDDVYSVSFRAISGTKDVSLLARALGGGGHKPAAGAKFEAANILKAVEKVNSVILEP